MNIICTPEELGLRLVLTPDNPTDIAQLQSVETGTQSVFVQRSELGQLLTLSATLKTVRLSAAPELVVESAPPVDAPKEVVPVAPDIVRPTDFDAVIPVPPSPQLVSDLSAIGVAPVLPDQPTA